MNPRALWRVLRNLLVATEVWLAKDDAAKTIDRIAPMAINNQASAGLQVINFKISP